MDACKAPGGIVHVIDQFFSASSESVADVVARYQGLTTFTALLEISSTAKQLLDSCPQLTVFAPTDQSLKYLNDPKILDCLEEEQNQMNLDAFLLQHMVSSVEYSSTLFFHNTLKSKNCYSTSYQNCTTIKVSVNDGLIVLGEESEIIEHDIPTASGVVHVISKPLVEVVSLINTCLSFPPTASIAETIPTISTTPSTRIITVTTTITSTVIVTPSGCPIK